MPYGQDPTTPPTKAAAGGYGKDPTTKPEPKSAAAPQDKPGGLAALWEGLKRGGMEAVEGAATIGARMPEEGAMLPGAQDPQAMMQQRQQDVAQLAQRNQQAYAQNPARMANPGMAEAGRFGGNVVGSALATAPLSMLPGGAGMGAAARMGLGAAQGAAGAGVMSGGSPGGMAAGAAGGGLLGGAGAMIGPALSQRLQQIATTQGLEPLWRMATGAAGRTEENFEKAAADQVLAPIGQTIDRGVKVGHALVNAVADKLSDAYNAVVPKLTFRPNPRFVQNLKALGDEASGGGLADAQASQFTKILKGLEEKLKAGGGVLDGKAFKQFESDVGRKAIGYSSGKAAPETQELGHALFNLQGHLRQALADENPEFAPQLQRINDAWSRYVRFATASERHVDKEGRFAPMDLLQAVGKGREKTRFSFGKGDNVMQAFAEAGNHMVTGKPSGLSLVARLMTQAAGEAGGAVMGGPGGAVAGGMAGRATPELMGAAQRLRQFPAAREHGRAVAGAAPAAGVAASEERVSPIGP